MLHRRLTRRQLRAARGAGSATAPRRVTGPARAGGAFTLIEILIVVVILGILAAVVIPRFAGATNQAREATVKKTLQQMRSQIEMFRFQHRDVLPGYPGGDRTASPTEAAFIEHMTRYTDEMCTVSANKTMVFRYGPYLSQIPANPLTGGTRVRVATGSNLPAAQDHKTYGWIYHPGLQKIVPNIEGVDSNGTPFRDY